jgi:predicted permease
MPDFRAWVREHLPRLSVTPEREAEIVGELALQLEQAYQESLSGGATPEAALKRARLQFPDWTALAQEINTAERAVPAPIVPETRSGFWTGGMQDLRYSLRLLRKNPLFAASAVLTLAFGIGANTSIFSVADVLALRSLPYDDPSRLVAIETRKPRQPEVDAWSSALDFFDLRERSQSFSAVAGISPIWNVPLSSSSGAERLEALYVSSDFFPMLGVQAIAGRTFLKSEDVRAKVSNVVVLSHAFWRRKFGENTSAIGQKLGLGANAYTIIGVLPPDFRYLGEPVSGTASDIDIWMPLSDNQLTGSARGLRFLKLIGRLKPGVTTEQARGEVQRIGADLSKQFPDTNQAFDMSSLPLETLISGRVRPTMLLLLAAVGLILLLACANVANLLLARTAARQKEISVRVALGASSFRLVRQLFMDGLVLSVAGGIAGVALAFAALKVFQATGPISLVHGRNLALDLRALIFTTVVVGLSALLSGLPPAWRLIRSPVADALREAGRGLTAGGHRLRSALVAAEIALALTLLVGAGLLIHSFVKLLEVDLGFESKNLATLTVQMPGAATTPAQREPIYRSVRDAIRGVPGVRDVAAVTRLPLMGSNLGSWMWIEGRPMRSGEATDVEYRRATAGYFATMGIPLRSGRYFEDRDDLPNAPQVVMINEAVARKLFPNQDPVGKRIKLGANPDTLPWVTIVGVVGNVRHFAVEVEPRPEVYQPVGPNALFSPIMVVRTTGDPRALLPAINAAVRGANSDCPVYNVLPLEDLVSRSTSQRRFVMTLLAAFSGVALLLAAVGVYGIVAQSVALRTPEIGLRMALGATQSTALKLVFGEGMRLTLIGAAVGIAAAAALARLMKNLLYGIAPLDPVVFLLAAVALIALAALACLAPAWRATRIEPLEALRHD